MDIVCDTSLHLIEYKSQDLTTYTGFQIII